MKTNLMALVLLVAVILSVSAQAGSSVSPAICSITNFRGEASAQAGSIPFFRGASILFTNCVVYSGGSTSSAIQQLSNVTVQVSIGQLGSAVVGTGTVASASGGSWWFTTTVPTNYSNPFLQVKLTDDAGNSFIYPWKTLATQDPLK